MQRYHAPSCTSAVNNSAIGGASARDSSRVDSSSIPSNFPVNPRRAIQLTAYKLRCEKEPLNSRLGPPDFHPPTPNCPEETLTREYVQSGYRETVEGLDEAREISLSQVQAFPKPVIVKCKEAIRKCHRAINESRAHKRKAGQVYGIPLSGTLLVKPGLFPEQKACGEEFRKKWIEGLSQPHKRLRLLADHVPHGYRKKSLFEVLIRNNVPLLRATWFIKVTYLNQVRPSSSNVSSGSTDKIQLTRSEHWTKDVTDYLQFLLDEFVSKSNSQSTVHSRDRSTQVVYTGPMQNKSDIALASVDGEEPSVHFKWWYVVRILQWHLREGLIIPSLIIDWVLKQLHEKEMLGVLQLLLPVIYGVIETIILSQSYVRTLVGVAVRFMQEPSPGGSDLVNNSRRAYITYALVELLRYLIWAVPDTFVAFDCFPLPSSVVFHVVNDGSFLSKISENAGNLKNASAELASVLRDRVLEDQYESLSIKHAVSSIQKCADNLTRSSRPAHLGRNMAKAVQVLDRTLVQGDLRVAFKFLFEDLCDGAIDERWIAEVSPCLLSSLKWIGRVSLSFISSVFFICEWATSDSRDFRTAPPHGLKFTGRKDFSQVYIAIRLLKLKTRDIQNMLRSKNGNLPGVSGLTKATGQLNNYHGRAFVGNVYELKNSVECRSRDLPDIFQSPGPLHDIIVCWIDQHEVQNGEGFKRLQLLITELTRSGVFYPQAYVRQLIVSSTMDKNGTVVDQERRRRHYKMLKQLPGSYICDVLGEARIAEMPILSEAMRIYSNERRLLLNELLKHHNAVAANSLAQKQKNYPTPARDGASSPSVDQWRALRSACTTLSQKNGGKDVDLEELRASILILLQLPKHSSGSVDLGLDESQGSVKRPIGLVGNNLNQGEETPGCEECRRAKRQKLSEERSSYLPAHSPNPSDDEETWWMRKGQKPMESFKADPPLKPAKQALRGRRKTQSLAQLAAARIEGSQGASTSHVCDNRTSCPNHRAGSYGDTSKLVDGIKTSHGGDILSIGKVLKQLRYLEKRRVMVWLIATLKQLVEESEKTGAKVAQHNRPLSTVDDQGSLKWNLGEDELSVILYLMDVCDDLVSTVRFLLWLLPKVPSGPNPTIHGGRNILMLPRNVENHVCVVGEAFVLSAIRRYESIIVSADLFPETLSAMLRRAAVVLASNGRISSSAALIYARQLLTKYGKVASVIEWERHIRATCDKRLFSELESGRSATGDYGFPLGVPSGIEDLDDFLRQKITGVRVSRVGLSMKEMVQRHVDEIFHYFYGKERKLFGAGTIKNPSLEKLEDVYRVAQQIVMGLMDCIRQTGGAAQEGDPNLVSSAVCAIVSNMGQFIAKMPDLTANTNHSNSTSSLSSLNLARRILRVHITCLFLLKEALGERQSRVFEIALAVEASSALAQVFGPAKTPRSQSQPSPESHDVNASMSNETLNNSMKVVLGRTTKITAAVSALVVGAILHGVATLERMVTVFRLKEGLDIIQFVRGMRSNSNGNARCIGTVKMDNLVEVSVHWFRVLIGNCMTVSDGFIVELLGEASIVALSRMQRTLPQSLVLPPAFSIFAFVAWRPFILGTSAVTREDLHQLYPSLTLAIGDAIKHLPFRDVCLRDTRGFYDLITADSTDSEFAAVLELNGPEMHLKAMAFVPLRARLFLDAIIDCRMPQLTSSKDDDNRVFSHGEAKVQHAEKETKVLDKLVHVLDTLQASKFHWQWVQLRLLLNEQALIEKMEAHDVPLAEAVRSLSPTRDKGGASESENYFTEIILTRLLVRPDAAPLFSEVIHLFGRSLEDSMLLHAKWFLRGSDVLLGRKSIRQRLIEIAESKNLSTKIQFSKPWGWSYSDSDLLSIRGDKQKLEISSLEEGEVVDEGTDAKRYGRASTQFVGVEGLNFNEQNVTERALVELVLHCLDQCSDESRNIFASDLITQMANIEQQINALTHGTSKQGGTVSVGIEGSANKSSSRKGMRGGSPGLARRPAQADTVPPAPGALRASMSLRLQFLFRLLPVICADGEPSGRNMRHMLAPVILRLLGSRVVHEDTDQFSRTNVNSLSRREVELSMDVSAAGIHLSGESLFDRLLLLLHGLLSSWQPSWLKLKSVSKSTTESSRDFAVFDIDVAEKLQNELDRMQLPDSVRWRIQTAMPMLFPSIQWSLSCQPPFVSPVAVAHLQPSVLVSGFSSGSSNLAQKNQVSLVRTATNVAGKTKAMQSQQEPDTEIDPWILLEDGTGSGPSSGNAAAIGCTDHANLRASSLLKGTVRVRRTDLTYIGAVDDDS